MLFNRRDEWKYLEFDMRAQVALSGLPFTLDARTYFERIDYWTQRHVRDRITGSGDICHPPSIADILRTQGDVSDLLAQIMATETRAVATDPAQVINHFKFLVAYGDDDTRDADFHDMHRWSNQGDSEFSWEEEVDSGEDEISPSHTDDEENVYPC